MHKVYFDSLSFFPEQEEIKNVLHSSFLFIPNGYFFCLLSFIHNIFTFQISFISLLQRFLFSHTVNVHFFPI